ncbi:MAG: phosphomannomutase/phosphoglucomutase [Nitrospirae bacterium]|nr:phosphomannomutase/phosphoglucomutase [Nitrospirota bacterium]
MTPNIFRQYDIRGTIGVDLDADTARAIGRAIGTKIRRNGGASAAVGRDCRMSSPELSRALAEGILSTGVSVLDIGLSTTPLLYFAVFTERVDGGVMITGSHNPPDMNGFKMLVGKDTIHGDDIQHLLRLIEAGDFEAGTGKLTEKDVKPAYIDHLASSLKIRSGLRIGLDFGNGTGSITTIPVLERMGCAIHTLFSEPDGMFPNHHPDPTVVKNLRELSAMVREKKLDAGIAYDGDADRIGVVDEKGDVIFGDMLMVLYSRRLLAENPGAAVIGEVKCSQRMYDDIAAHGGRPIMWKTGHSLIKDKLKQEDALLAGEMSGHIFFRDRYFGFDDACYATLRLLEILSEEPRSALSGKLADIPPAVSTPEIRVDCPDDIKFGVVERAVSHFSGRYETITVDGVRILFENGWGLIRVSNTQPVIVLRFEAGSEAELSAYSGEVYDFLRGEGITVSAH